MQILVVGSGGREHALIWKIKQSPLVKKVYCASGNAGIGELAELVPIEGTDVKKLAQFAKQKGVDLTLVGPEVPLTAGIVDEFVHQGLRIFGPDKKAAEIEGSKVFTKNLMKKYKIPSGYFQVFDDPEEAKRYIREVGMPIVVKADGLAAGKGVMVCHQLEEALDAVKKIMEDKIFGDAGDRLVVEECLFGEEASFLAFSDGEHVLPMASSQDHKPVYDDDKGPNTGGMGAYSPAPVVTPEVHDKIMNQIMLPTIRGMKAEGRPYKGVLYAGLMINNGVPKVLEFNARFGDPEAQPLVIRMKSDLVPVLEAVIDERLHEVDLEWYPEHSVCVVMASGGYPGPYEKGIAINGLQAAAQIDNVVVFHAGTALKDGKVVTNGGRVLGVTARGQDIKEAIHRAYQAVHRIQWEGAHYRSDIGKKALARL